MTEFELFQALRPMYPAREYALLPQVADGTGAGQKRHADALALSLWPSRGLYLSGFEIKCYRGDWLREKKDPAKAEEIAQFCNYWWIVASGPFIKPDELPQPWGLLVWDGEKQALQKVKAAPFRESVQPDIGFIAAILRKSQDVLTPAGVLEATRKEAYEKGRQEGARELSFDRKELEQLQKRVADFEKAAGFSITEGWNEAADVGAAVKTVLHGTVEDGRKRLLKIAERLVIDLGGEATGEAVHL